MTDKTQQPRTYCPTFKAISFPSTLPTLHFPKPISHPLHFLTQTMTLMLHYHLTSSFTYKPRASSSPSITPKPPLNFTYLRFCLALPLTMNYMNFSQHLVNLHCNTWVSHFPSVITNFSMIPLSTLHHFIPRQTTSPTILVPTDALASSSTSRTAKPIPLSHPLSQTPNFNSTNPLIS